MRCGLGWCDVVWYGVAWRGVARGVGRGVAGRWGEVWCGVVWCGVEWRVVANALLPKGNGRDVLHTGKCKTGGP